MISYYHHTLFHLRDLKGNFLTLQLPQLINTKIFTPRVERIVHGFSLNSSPDLPPFLPNYLNQHNTKFLRSFNAAVDLTDTLQSNGILNINRSLSPSTVEKTNEKQNLDLEVQLAVRVRFRGFYVL